MNIQLTQGKVATIDEIDSDLAQFKWCFGKGYAVRHGPSPKRGLIFLHKVVAERVGIVGPADHVNRKKLDCRRANLRAATASQNSQNVGRRANNTSGYIGVSRHRGKWQALISIEGKNKHLGCFATPIEAARAYNAIARYRGAFAILNRIEIRRQTNLPVLLERRIAERRINGW